MGLLGSHAILSIILSEFDCRKYQCVILLQASLYKTISVVCNVLDIKGNANGVAEDRWWMRISRGCGCT